MKPNDQSTEEQGPQENDSVFDFLYYDTSRIASFLAQFDPAGHLTQITNNERAHRASKESTSLQASGSIAVAKGTVTEGSDATAEYGRQTSKSYDPRWANALAFLDYLEQRDLLSREIGRARIGQLVLITGDLSIFDLSILQKMWALPTIKKTLMAGARDSSSASADQIGNRSERRRSSAQSRKVTTAPSETELALEMMSVLPHAVQAAVSDDDISAWCTLREDSISVSPSDLFMKHGMTITGRWAMVGILDAFPDEDGELADGVALETGKQLLAGSKLGMLGFMLAPHLAEPVRLMLGRPATSYGVTPLLIFRDVSGA